MKHRIRFRPPTDAIGAEVALALDLAFGPVVDEGLEPWSPSADRLIEVCDRLVVAARIGARWSARRLENAFGPEIAAAFVSARRKAAAQELKAEAVIQDLAEVAASMDLPIVILKGGALMLRGTFPPGSRGMCDVDVLAPEGREEAFQERLKAKGWFEPPDLPSGEHQLQVLGHPVGLAVEVHHCLRGVRNADGNSFGWSDLDEGGFLDRVESLPGESFIPKHDVLLAHALVHGLAQHGLNPKGYPLLRVVGDLVDLDLAGPVDGEDADRWLPLIDRDVSRLEVVALARLCRRLTEGEGAASVWSGKDGAGSMLRHFVLGSTDTKYRDSLRIRSLATALPSGGRFKTLVRTVWGTLILTRGQVDALYGQPSSAWGYWGYRLYRPFDLVVRLFRYGWAAVKGRFRR